MGGWQGHDVSFFPGFNPSLRIRIRAEGSGKKIEKFQGE
jgi:hypothetical protein